LDQPFLLMVAGPNGSGKTTLTRMLVERGVELGEYINPDDIARDLSGSDFERAARAQVITDRRRAACITEKRSFSFETVMSHPSKVEILHQARDAGFFVQLFFVGIDDPRTNVERVALRVAQGGHDVPIARIAPRWFRSMGLLYDAIRASDDAYLFDNSATGPTAVGPRLVFFWRHAEELSMATYQEFPPIPDWVERYVLKPYFHKRT
jgi:predicted ABC-type ATPase